MEAAEQAEDWKALASRDLDFHTALVAAAESPRLERMFTTVISETRLCLSMLATDLSTARSARRSAPRTPRDR
jgi:DNA-binding GntR family transcriptional regulator